MPRPAAADPRLPRVRTLEEEAAPRQPLDAELGRLLGLLPHPGLKVAQLPLQAGAGPGSGGLDQPEEEVPDFRAEAREGEGYNTVDWYFSTREL